MIQAPQMSTAVENYQLIVGKTSVVKHPYKKAIFYLQGVNTKINIEVKLFNDGVAFRYVFPLQTGKKHFTLLDETTQFNLTGNPVAKVLLLPNFTTSHEGLYTTAALSSIQNDTLMDMPALFEFPDKTYLAITEAALVDYAGMYLTKKIDSTRSPGIPLLTSQLSPMPKDRSDTASLNHSGSHRWRGREHEGRCIAACPQLLL